MSGHRIPFTRVHVTGREIDYLQQVIEANRLAGDGKFTERCREWLERTIGCARALLVHSATAALDMASILSKVGPGDEVIMPSFTFVSTANAFVLRGATPVFVDIAEPAMNLDPRLVAAAVTNRTRAIVPVHYGGVACDMEPIMALARDAGLLVIEDAAQALLSTWRGRPLGSIGALGALSFHETKNVTAGEGGALLINDPRLVERAEVVREKGTDRSRFFRGEVDKYTWVDVGSSYLPSELTAAFLFAQLEHAEEISALRAAVWRAYDRALEPLERAGLLRRQREQGNAHIYFVLLPSLAARTRLIADLDLRGVSAAFHYVPLHSSPAGLRYGRAAGPLPVTDDISARLLRLPLWADMTEQDVAFVVAAIQESLG
jgi:dTDP-4-amino-4,6-dideoxygalactose transaminase